jgi:hypothetical protein
MCMPIHQRDVRTRALFVLANLSLSAGIALPHLVHATTPSNLDWLDASRGLLIGISHGMNLLLFGRIRGRRKNATNTSNS